MILLFINYSLNLPGLHNQQVTLCALKKIPSLTDVAHKMAAVTGNFILAFLPQDLIHPFIPYVGLFFLGYFWGEGKIAFALVALTLTIFQAFVNIVSK